jgi:DNA-binding NarL/FixJ family response regulator
MKKSKLSVLIVDDYEPWRRFVCTCLEKQLVLAAVTEASDGSEAVQKAYQDQPDLIVLDIGLPRLNGIEAARQIFQRASKSKILFCSEDRSCDVVQETVRIGGSGYVVKSSAAEELWPAIQAVLRGETYFSSCLANLDLDIAQPSATSVLKVPYEDRTTPLGERLNDLIQRLQPLGQKFLARRVEIWGGLLAFIICAFFVGVLRHTSLSSQKASIAARTTSSPVVARASIGRVDGKPARSSARRKETLQPKRFTAEFQSAMRQIHNLRLSVNRDRSLLSQMKANMHQEQLAREALEAKLQQVLDKEASVEAELVASRYRNAELEHKFSSEAVLAERDRQLIGLSSRLEVRDLITARNLHIVDVVDSESGQSRKPFGRLFFAQGKALIFYAYDLSSARSDQMFYVWGYREGYPHSTRSLGVFREDNEVDKRWVFKLDDSEILADIDSVCVTSEPAGMPHDEPTGKTLLTAYLGRLRSRR